MSSCECHLKGKGEAQNHRMFSREVGKKGRNAVARRQFDRSWDPALLFHRVKEIMTLHWYSLEKGTLRVLKLKIQVCQ